MSGTGDLEKPFEVWRENGGPFSGSKMTPCGSFEELSKAIDSANAIRTLSGNVAEVRQGGVVRHSTESFRRV